MLKVNELSVSYGKHQALDKVSIEVARGEIVVILGANGAGKTTLLKSLAGLVKPSPGSEILIDDRNTTSMKPHQIVEAGLALVPEGRGIFGELSVSENLELGAFAKHARDKEEQNRREVLELFPRLEERLGQMARVMSGGEQQMVAIGRALMSSPQILMLDEPSLGLSPLLCGELFKALERVRETGAGMLLVEQNAVRSLEIADRGYLLENGRIIDAGSADELRQDDTIKHAYLGGAL